jgi:regulator of sigma E protease
MLSTLFYFFLTLMVLIFIHESGHFIVARLCGVKVLRFSLGFGKVLASWHDKRGTEFAWSLIPLGGYVKMLDETEGPVPANERHLAFNNQSLAARSAIVVAGPLFNFLFAFFALWLVLILGMKSIAPMIQSVSPGSLAAQAGMESHQEILSLDDRAIVSWRDFQYALMQRLGTEKAVKINVKSLKTGEEKTLFLPLAHWHLDTKKPDVLASFGITPFIPSIPPIVGEVIEKSPADVAGLKKGDEIVRLNDNPLNDWLMLVDFVKKHPNQTIKLLIKHQGHLKIQTLMIGHMSAQGKHQGYLGVRSQPVHWPPGWLRLQREAPVPALGTALLQTKELTQATFALVGRLATGKLPLQSLSGPVGIAEGAGESGRSGLTYYLAFLALLSISLGVLNLLPIPMLDGGHLVYFFLEMVSRRPLSDGFKSASVYFGMIVLVTLMIIALNNDLSRLN